jgi:hypothetical protein
MSTPKKVTKSKMSTSETSIRKRPGRPRKKISKDIIKKEGIVDTPSEIVEDDRMQIVMEMVYGNPELFKKIFTELKNLSVENLRLQFHAEGISFITKDHLEKSELLGEIIGARLNRYYCESPFEIAVDQTHLLQILQTLKKDHSKITFISIRNTQRSRLRIILHNPSLNEDSGYTIEVKTVPEYDGTIREDLKYEAEYPLSFELDAKYFKAKVADWDRLGEVIKIEKLGDSDSPLVINHSFEDKKGDHETVFRDPKKINLVANITEGDLFAVSVLLQNLKPISNSTVADKIKISAHENHRLMFTSLLDQQIDESSNKPIDGTEVCIIKILTEIVSFVDNEDN